MIISKAIEILKLKGTLKPEPSDQDTFDAIKLGKEAMKRIQNGRLHPFFPMYAPLPGENMPERGIR